MIAGMVHGKRSSYSAGCRCELCRRANAEYERKRQHRITAQDWGEKYQTQFVYAAHARNRIDVLLRNGWSKRGICRESGIPKSTMHNLTVAHHRTGRPVDRCRAETIEKLKALPVKPPYPMGDHCKIPKLYRYEAKESEPYYKWQRDVREVEWEM